jgi:hypothetical protein
MLIKLASVAEAPSRRAITADSRQPAEFGPGAVACVRGRRDLATEAGWMSGIWGGGDNVAAGYLPGLGGAFRLGQLAASPVQASQVKASVVTKSTVQNSTDQHNTNQVTLLIPAIRDGVGPHPGKEPWPA